MTYRVKNWERFQHYHKPRPAWIKLHRTLLDDMEFHALSTRSRALLVMLWLIAAESNDGTIPGARGIAWRLRLSEREVFHDIQSLTHYLEPLYNDSSEVLVSDRERDREREEIEGEGEGASKRPSPKLKYLDFILLTEHEHAEIVAKLNGNAGAYLERLNGYIGQTGRRYKSHYHTILNWYRKDVDAGKVFTDPEPPAPVEKCSSCGVRAAFKSGMCAPCLSEAKVKA